MTGMVIHATVGAIWAIFYAYFFWSTFDWPPAFQGMAFSLLPTLLALFIAYPQLQMMHLDVPTALFNPVAIIRDVSRSEEHTSELQSLMRISYAVFCLTKNNLTPQP